MVISRSMRILLSGEFIADSAAYRVVVLPLPVGAMSRQLSPEAILARVDSLTTREREVMQQLITGALNKTVADRLQIAVKTVKVHRAHTMEKMGVRSVAELLHLCHLAGIEPDSDFSP